MKLVETRIIDTGKVRSMCIRNNYFTSGTNEESAGMFEMCKVENPTTDNFVEIANCIYWCSDWNELKTKTGMPGSEIIKAIMFELINDCTITYIED